MVMFAEFGNQRHPVCLIPPYPAMSCYYEKFSAAEAG